MKDLIEQLVIFMVFWVVSLFLWSIWVDGIQIPLYGFITAIVFSLLVTLNSILNKKYCK